MQRVRRSNAVPTLPPEPGGLGPPGFFSEGNAAGGIPATTPGPEWFNGVQEELIGLILRAGLTPDVADHAQVRKALDRLYGGGNRYVTANATLTADDAGLVVVDALSGNITITLPAVNAAAGRPMRLQFVRHDSDANTVTIQRAGSDTIEFLSSIQLRPLDRLSLVSDSGSMWRVDGRAALAGRQVFAANGTFVVPAGVYAVTVRVWGAGGGGGGGASAANGFAGTGGAGGGYAERRCAVTPGQNVAVTVGAGGARGGAGGAGGAGGSSSFGAFCSATGGAGGQHQAITGTTQSAPGAGTGGDINGVGGPGSQVFPPSGSAGIGGFGGAGAFGGGGSSHSIGAASNGAFPAGGGGGAGGTGGALGGAGAAGLVVVEWGV